MPTDSELLSRYVDRGDEAAFEEIVARYLPLVRGVLWRRMGKTDAVDELAMQAFAALAQNAGDLRQRASIGGWLVITARQKSAENLRKTATRKRHMDKLAEHEAAHAGALHQTATLDEATSYLDDALASLGEADRDAVLLHFYDGLPYREIGQRIARGEDAARKRVNKALERMAAFLKRRGVTLTGTALAGGLTTTLTPTAQGASAAAVSKGALEIAASSAVPTTVATASLAKWALAATAVFTLSTGAGYISTPNRPGPSSSPAAEALPTTRPGFPTALTRTRPAYQVLSPEVAARLRDPVQQRLQLAVDLWDEQGKRRSAYHEYTRVMESFTAEEAKEAIVLLDRDHTYDRNRHMRMGWKLIEAIMRTDPAAGAEYAMERRNSGDPNWQRHKRIGTVVGDWADIDPAGAREWLARQDFPDHIRSPMVENLLRTTSRTEPEPAVELLLELPRRVMRNACGMFQSYERPELRESTLDAVAAVADETDRALIFRGGVLRRIDDFEEVEPAFHRMNFTPGDAVMPVLDELLSRQLARDLSQLPDAFDLVFDHAPEAAHAHLLDRYAKKWLKKEPAAARSWLESRGLAEEDIAAATASFRLR